MVFFDFDAEDGNAEQEITLIIAFVFGVDQSAVDIISFAPGSVAVNFETSVEKNETTEAVYSDLNAEKAEALFVRSGYGRRAPASP